MTATQKHLAAAEHTLDVVLCSGPEVPDYRAEAIEAIAAALAAAEREGMKRAAEICEKMSGEFLSPRYASNQPIGSLTERFACDECVRAILSDIEGD